MGFFKSIFGGPEKGAEPEAAAAPVVVEEEEELAEPEIVLSDDELSALSALARCPSGTSLEAFGETMGQESMTLLYRLDKLVKLGLVSRSRPMFREPEVYEITGRGQGIIEEQE